MKHNKHEQGLSAVELLITLFVGSMFLMSGYLLWGYTQRASDEAYHDIIASDIARDYLSRYGTKTPCTSPGTNVTMPDGGQPDTPSASKLTNPIISIRIDCPADLNALRIVKVTSTLSHGSGDTARSVSHAVFAK
jgi:hypothetical protein